jgi:hypothetical protein
MLGGGAKDRHEFDGGSMNGRCRVDERATSHARYRHEWHVIDKAIKGDGRGSMKDMSMCEEVGL